MTDDPCIPTQGTMLIDWMVDSSVHNITTGKNAWETRQAELKSYIDNLGGTNFELISEVIKYQRLSSKDIHNRNMFRCFGAARVKLCAYVKQLEEAAGVVFVPRKPHRERGKGRGFSVSKKSGRWVVRLTDLNLCEAEEKYGRYLGVRSVKKDATALGVKVVTKLRAEYVANGGIV